MADKMTDKMTAVMKRRAVAVAEDVLVSLKVMNIYRTGYLTANSVGDVINSNKGSKQQAQALKKHCTVCALGACFLSAVSISNRFNFKDELYLSGNGGGGSLQLEGSKITGRLQSVFTAHQMALIENAFELGKGPLISQQEQDIDAELVYASKTFGRRYKNSKDRLRAIMKNIVKNGGEFKP